MHLCTVLPPNPILFHTLSVAEEEEEEEDPKLSTLNPKPSTLNPGPLNPEP